MVLLTDGRRNLPGKESGTNMYQGTKGEVIISILLNHFFFRTSRTFCKNCIVNNSSGVMCCKDTEPDLLKQEAVTEYGDVNFQCQIS